MRKFWSTWFRRVCLALAAVLFPVNLAVSIWHWKADKQLRELRAGMMEEKPFQSFALQQQAKALLAQVTPRYNAEVDECRTLWAMLQWVRDAADFPVTSGEEIVALVIVGDPAEKRPLWTRPDKSNRIRLLVYIPPGDLRLKYSFKEAWNIVSTTNFELQAYSPDNKNPYSWKNNTVTLDLPTGKVHEIDFLIEESGKDALLRVSVADHDERTFPLRSSTISNQTIERRITRVYPNQIASPMDALYKWGELSRQESVRNEVLNVGMTMNGRRQGRKEGGLRLRCWIEADLPVSESAITLAVNSKKFLQRNPRAKRDDMFSWTAESVPDVDKLFRPYDGSGNLYYFVAPRVD